MIKYIVCAGLLSLVIIHLSFDLMSLTTGGLGRDETLTGRTGFWEELLQMSVNPLLGTGYEGFWMGDRIAQLWNKYWWRPNQAHNGYLEIYLNLGIVGLALLAALIMFMARSIFNGITSSNRYDFQILRLAFLLIMLAINFTEANFKGFIWLVFLFFAIEPERYKCAPKISEDGQGHSQLTKVQLV